MDLPTLFLTLKIAFATTSVLIVFGLPLAYWIANTKSHWSTVLEVLLTLPLILPPTVLGFFLLVSMGRGSWAGELYREWMGATLPFSFMGIWIGSVLCSIPFALRPFIAAFRAVDRRLMEAAWCLGESRWGTFYRVAMPLAWPGIVAGIALTVAHCFGEFGVVLMIGGNIPGVTRTLSIAIYDDVQSLQYASAMQSSLVLLLMSVCSLVAIQFAFRGKVPSL